MRKCSKQKQKNSKNVKLRSKEQSQKLIQRVKDVTTECSKLVVPLPSSDSKIRLGSDCTGLGSDVLALALHGLLPQVESKFWSDKDPVKQKLYRTLCKELGHDETGHFDSDISTRNLMDDAGGTVSAQYEGCDLYVAGFPCPSYSSAGKRKGHLDVRGQVGLYGLEFIARGRPSVCILENVRGLMHRKHSAFTQLIRDTFHAVGYRVWKKLLTTKAFGIPQSRVRIYIVAIRTDCLMNKFRWPKEMRLSKNALKRHLNVNHCGGGTPATGGRTPDLSAFEQKYGKKEIWTGPYILDVGSSPGWQSAKRGVCPCLTRSRLGANPCGYFIPKLNRRLSTWEAAGLQGFPYALVQSLIDATSEQQVRQALGDSMSVNVLSKVMLSCLYAIGKIQSVEKHDIIWTPEAVAAKGAFPGGTGDDALQRHLSTRKGRSKRPHSR